VLENITCILERNMCRVRWREIMLQQYCEYLRYKGDKPATIDWHRQKLEIFKEYLLSLPYLQRNQPVTSNTIRGYLQLRSESGVSQNTIAGDFRALKALFSWACKEGHLPTNPCNGMKPVKAEPCQQMPFTPKELAKVINIIDNSNWVGKRNIAIILFLADTGCRVTALTNIKNEEMDLIQRRVYVTDKYSKRRWLSWGNRTTDALINYYEARPKSAKCDNFFINDKLSQLTRSGVYLMFQRSLKQAGVAPRKLHMLRASYACQFLIAGGPDRQWQLQLAMGLADDSQIKNVYGRTVMDDLTLSAMRELSPADRLPTSPNAGQ